MDPSSAVVSMFILITAHLNNGRLQVGWFSEELLAEVYREVLVSSTAVKLGSIVTQNYTLSMNNIILSLDEIHNQSRVENTDIYYITPSSIGNSVKLIASMFGLQTVGFVPPHMTARINPGAFSSPDLLERNLYPSLDEEARLISSLLESFTHHHNVHLLVQRRHAYDGFAARIRREWWGGDSLLDYQVFESSADIARLLRGILSLWQKPSYKSHSTAIILHVERELVSNFVTIAEILFHDRRVIWIVSSLFHADSSILESQAFLQNLYPGMITLKVPPLDQEFVSTTSRCFIEQNTRTESPQQVSQLSVFDIWRSNRREGTWMKLGQTGSCVQQHESIDWSVFVNKDLDKRVFTVVTIEDRPFVTVSQPITDPPGATPFCLVPHVPCLNITKQVVVRNGFSANLINQIYADWHRDTVVPGREYELRCCEGFMIDLLMTYAASLDFEYQVYLSPDEQYGAYDPTLANWTGMVKELMDGRADMVLASFSVTEKRAKVINYSCSFYFSGRAMLSIKREDLSLDILNFAKPFGKEMWFLLIGMSIIVFTCHAIMEWFSPSGTRRTGPHVFTLGSSIKSIFSLLCGNTIPCKIPRAWPTKWLQNVWGLFSIVWLAAYTANLTSYTTNNTSLLSVDSLYDPKLLNQRVGALRNSATMNYLKLVNPKLGANMVPIKNKIQGNNMLHDGSLDAFISDTPAMDYLLSQENHKCALAIIAHFSTDSYAAAFPYNKNSKLREAISRTTLELQQTNYFERLKRMYFTYSKGCRAPVHQAQLSLHKSIGLFIALIIASSLCGLCLFFEHLIFGKCLPKVQSREKPSIFKSKFMLFVSQRFYRAVNNPPVKNTEVFTDISRKITRAKEMMNKLRNQNKPAKWTFYELVQHVYEKEKKRSMAHIFIQKRPDYKVSHNSLPYFMGSLYRQQEKIRPSYRKEQAVQAGLAVEQMALGKKRTRTVASNRRSEFCLTNPAYIPSMDDYKSDELTVLAHDAAACPKISITEPDDDGPAADDIRSQERLPPCGAENDYVDLSSEILNVIYV